MSGRCDICLFSASSNSSTFWWNSRWTRKIVHLLYVCYLISDPKEKPSHRMEHSAAPQTYCCKGITKYDLKFQLFALGLAQSSVFCSITFGINTHEFLLHIRYLWYVSLPFPRSTHVAWRTTSFLTCAFVLVRRWVNMFESMSLCVCVCTASEFSIISIVSRHHRSENISLIVFFVLLLVFLFFSIHFLLLYYIVVGT